jgi:hypothetical protein
MSERGHVHHVLPHMKIVTAMASQISFGAACVPAAITAAGAVKRALLSS